jgi:hypothetical protein
MVLFNVPYCQPWRFVFRWKTASDGVKKMRIAVLDDNLTIGEIWKGLIWARLHSNRPFSQAHTWRS